MAKRFLDHNPYTGITEIFHTHGVEKGFVIEKIQDVAPILERNKQIRNNGWHRVNDHLHHVAAIPTSIWEAWWKEFGGDPFAKENRARLKAKLNDPDFAYFKTSPGKI